jgi:disulfide bond formation protein DsbB
VIDEAIGKILGMAMAYAVSSMGLLLAYVNYRKRILGADRVMTRRAWLVVVLAVLMTLGAAAVVLQLAATAGSPEPTVVDAPPPRVAPQPATAQPQRWSMLGLVLPGVVFLFATAVTAGLYRHFARRH